MMVMRHGRSSSRKGPLKIYYSPEGSYMPSVDEFGFNSSDDLEEKVYRKYMKNWREFEARLIDSDAKIRAELHRLDALWGGTK